jgi:lipocalin
MSTNYFDYAVVWSCFNIGEDRSNETFWVLSRNIVPSANTTARFNEVLTQNGALFEELRITNHDMDFCMRNKTVAAI